MRNFTAKRYCGGAQNELRHSKIEGMRELKGAFYFVFYRKTLSR
ncbi:hypothetical protein RUMHYD_01086 [Blautia hydrogenotrophica DSM 10507]|uniref:Uncharacterized protein n=1 Tax=Blautia hydrogenotrophica (strain DSM 10507 / JCM 14656 / S5a33) TaxID=476272 RepID=C0CJR6_BLAHS|nr:hypothetical protein RUMHYD_01086 [Blautia hydrogenotrophica DSM 10507]